MANDDAALAEKLKQELNFNQQRRKGFKKQNADLQVFNREREKGLSLFLEEQEKFDLEREKGLALHKKSKMKPLDESSPEYFADLKIKKEQSLWLETARKNHVKTRDQVIGLYSEGEQVSEMEELDLYNNRPRYDLRKRHNNKWVKSSSKSTGGSSSSGGSSFGSGAPVPENPTDFPAPIDYAPQPIENFDEIPPPPPPIPYDQNPGFESGFGDAPVPPPPPPMPEGGWDF